MNIVNFTLHTINAGVLNKNELLQSIPWKIVYDQVPGKKHGLGHIMLNVIYIT
jgi:hypothetical protein